MKKLGIFSGILMMALATIALTSCDDKAPMTVDNTTTTETTKEPEHVHSFKDNYEHDATSHWKVCECGEKNSLGNHEFEDNQDHTKNVCKVCNYSVDKEVIDMSGVKFENKSYAFTGNVMKLEITGTLPQGVTVTYENNENTAVGSYKVIAKFSCDTTKYVPIPNMEATLEITDAVSAITYDVNGGIGLDSNSQDAVYGQNVTLVTPARLGYEFAGWYNGDTLVESGTWSIFGNVVLVAKWNVVTYDVSYVLDGGTNASENPATYTTEDTFTLADAEKTGYTFIGWTGNGVETPTKNLEVKDNIGNLTFTANYTANKYTITYDVNGGIALENQTQEVTYGEAYTLKTPTRLGYEFVGWYHGSTKVESGTWNKTSDVTLIAHWNISTYSVSYNLNGGTALSTNPTTYTTVDTFTLGNVEKTGYTFTGWTGNGVTTPTKNLEVKDAIGNLTFTANFTANKYTVTYDVNGGEALTPSTQEVTYGEAYTLKTPKKAGYSFDGWSENSTKVDNSGTWTRTDNMSVVATWKLVTYTISYTLNGGKAVSANPTSYNVTQTITLNDCTRTGYTFTGWTGNGTSIATKGLQIKNATGNLRFVANYSPNKYTVTLDVNGGKPLSNTTLEATYGQALTLPTPEKAGYVLIGWYIKGTTTKVSSGSTWNRLDNAELEARWSLASYKITYHLFGATNPEANPSTYSYTDGIILSDAQLESHLVYNGVCYRVDTTSFDGWYTEPEFINKVQTIEAGSSGDLNLYAKFSKEEIDLDTYFAEGGSVDLYIKNGGDINTYLKLAGTYVRVDDDGNYDPTGSNIFFGFYPQTDVTETMGETLELEVSPIKPTRDNNQGFTSYKFYQSGKNNVDYTWYKDIDLDGDASYDYRCVYFDQYRPSYVTGDGSDPIKAAKQESSGYTLGKYYFFKYDAIKWRILTEGADTVTIICDVGLDSIEFNTVGTKTVSGQQVYANNYEYSHVRNWLIDTFYNTAFEQEQKDLINTVVVDNSASSTVSDTNPYAIDNTNDKIWTLSYKEFVQYYGSSSYDARRVATPYAKALGTMNTKNATYNGETTWWLRSPSDSDSNTVQYVLQNGKISTNLNVCDMCYFAIIPVLQLRLE